MLTFTRTLVHKIQRLTKSSATVLTANLVAMTISAHKTQHSKPRSGFTLLEIIITLAIISTIMGGAILMLTGGGSQLVDKVRLETQSLAKETLRDAKLHERPYSIIVSHEAIWSTPEVSRSEDDPLSPPEKGLINIPETVTVSYLIAGDEEWSTITKSDEPLVWAFTQSGLCGALSLRFEDEDSIHEMSFHPLTAGELADED